MSTERPAMIRMTKERWFALYEEWQSSGESQANFCKRKDINYHVFVYWRKKHNGNRTKPSVKSFATAKLAGGVNQPAVYARIILNDGTQIIIPADYPKAAVANLLQPFGASSC